MKALKELNNVQKAQLLHNLLPHEIPGLLAFLNEMTETVLNEREAIIANWKDPLFGADFWFGLAENIQARMAKCPGAIQKNAIVFADKLFGGYNAVFMVHTLTRFVVTEAYSDPKFKLAVELLFGQS